MLSRVGMAVAIVFFLVLGAANPAASQGEAKNPEAAAGEKQDRKAEPQNAGPDEKLSITRHTFGVKVGGILGYTATAGYLRLKDESGKPRADIFFVAYTAESGNSADGRPITFLFNGGPGASSVWLHMGVAGPLRVATGEGNPPVTPQVLAEQNPYSWLPWSDLVFIDPVGTGFSRAIPPENSRHFYNTRDDIGSVGDFIRLYTSRFGRWLSPKCLAGESYGGMRAAGLVEYLYENFGMEINGLILISPALDLHTIQSGAANDLPYVLFLPSYTAAAWFHKKIAPELQGDMGAALAEAEKWALDEYLPTLVKGDRITSQERDRVIKKLAGFTGLPEVFIRNRNLRVSRPEFTAELLRADGLALGFMDGRNIRLGRGRGFLNDPGMAATTGPYTAALNAYLLDGLKFSPGIPYVFFSDEVNSQWNWGPAFTGYIDAVESVRKALNRNRNLRILATAGYFDLDVPYFATRYIMSHLGSEPRPATNISLEFFPGGHMFYTSNEALEGFTHVVERFFRDGPAGNNKKQAIFDLRDGIPPAAAQESHTLPSTEHHS